MCGGYSLVNRRIRISLAISASHSSDLSLSSHQQKKAIPMPCAGRQAAGNYDRCAVSAGARHRFCYHLVNIPIRPLQMCEVERVLRILILEDYAPLCRVLAATLQRAGCEVVLVRSACETLRVLEQHAYDTLLVDMDMANGESWRALRALDSVPHAMPIVVLL